MSDTGQLVTSVEEPYTITVSYDDGELGMAIEDTLALYYWDGSQWVKDPSSVVDPFGNNVQATPDHFSSWAVLGEPRRVFVPLVMKNY